MTGSMEKPVLFILGGLPGTGKSTLSQLLARKLHAVHLRIDIIEHAMRESGIALNGPEGYLVAYRLAEHNLRLGLPVVADSVNPIEITRAAWREAALGAGAPFIEIQFTCSDAEEHRRRVETRPADIAGFALPTWQEVVDREYEPWETDLIVIDTAGKTVEQCFRELWRKIEER
jgi:predicted kinase